MKTKGGYDCSYLFIEDENGKEKMTVELDTGKIEPNRAKELLEKHGWKDKEE